MKSQIVLLCGALALVGCSFYARGPDSYREAVRGMLETKRPDVEACYKRSYEADQSAQGRVIAKFDVEPKSGKVVRPEIVNEGTTANEALKQCVLSSLEGLTLAPPDQRKGEATFTWEFAR
jgi:PBP1b-binding outer membrane lipoprotein LpoB